MIREDSVYDHEEHGRVVVISCMDGMVEFLPEESEDYRATVDGMMCPEEEFEEKSEPAEQTIKPEPVKLFDETPEPGAEQ